MNEDQKKALMKIERIMKQCRASIDPVVPTQLVQTFLAVALQEGQSTTELADRLNTNVSTASRHLLDLADRNRKMEEGYKLIHREQDPMNLRVNRYTLTPKGRLLASQLADILID